MTTGSALASGLAFFVATLPNLLLSPIAGTFVDRWDHKDTMVVSDILRAVLVLLVPVAASVNIVLVYPLIFLVTSVSVFFRPARVAILPKIVPAEDLLSANSAMWVGETIADIIGYPLAAIFVTSLGTLVPLAFWVDAATYVASAALLSTIVYAAATDRAVPGDAVTWLRGRASGRLELPPRRNGVAREHAAGCGRPVQPRHLDRPHTGVRPRDVQRHRAGFPDRVWTPGDRDRRREPDRRLRPRGRRLPVREGSPGYRGLRALGLPAAAFRPDGSPRASDRARVRARRREHGLHHPQPDPLPGADAAGTDGSRRWLSILRSSSVR